MVARLAFLLRWVPAGGIVLGLVCPCRRGGSFRDHAIQSEISRFVFVRARARARAFLEKARPLGHGFGWLSGSAWLFHVGVSRSWLGVGGVLRDAPS